MQHRRRIRSHVRSNLVAYIALFFALSGSAYAAGGLLIYSDNIVDGQVFSVDVADESLSGFDIRNGSLTGADVADGTVFSNDVANESLYGADILNGSLTGADVADNSLIGADIANGSLTGSDVLEGSLFGGNISDNSLTGADIAEDSLSVAAMGCQSGKVLGFARVKGLALAQDHVTGWTSDPRYIDITNNCAGGDVMVRMQFPGSYLLKFVGNPAFLAVATNNLHPYSNAEVDNIISVGKFYTDAEGWFFEVNVEDVCDSDSGEYGCRNGGTQSQSGDFTILLP